MRVGFLIDRWRPERGGAEQAMAEFAAHLVRAGHDVRAFALEGGGPGIFHRVRAPFALARGSRERALGEALAAAAEGLGCEATVGARHLPRVDLYWPHAGGHALLRHADPESGATLERPPEAITLSSPRMTYNGRSYYFSTISSRMKFEARPDSFAVRKGS